MEEPKTEALAEIVEVLNSKASLFFYQQTDLVLNLGKG